MNKKISLFFVGAVTILLIASFTNVSGADNSEKILKSTRARTVSISCGDAHGEYFGHPVACYVIENGDVIIFKPFFCTGADAYVDCILDVKDNYHNKDVELEVTFWFGAKLHQYPAHKITVDEDDKYIEERIVIKNYPIFRFRFYHYSVQARLYVDGSLECEDEYKGKVLII